MNRSTWQTLTLLIIACMIIAIPLISASGDQTPGELTPVQPYELSPIQPDSYEPYDYHFEQAPEGFPEGYWDGCCPGSERDEAQEERNWNDSLYGPSDGLYQTSTPFEQYVSGYQRAWQHYKDGAKYDETPLPSNCEADYKSGYQDGWAEAERQECARELREKAARGELENDGANENTDED